MFETNYSDIISKINKIDPIQYGRTRNYINGDITYLSPYISRGVISTLQVLESVIARGYKLNEIEPFVKELAWRDYFQRVWQATEEKIFSDFKQPQNDVVSKKIPLSILNGNTSIKSIDTAIHQLYSTGYMHNHLRMYTAMLTTNIAKTYWKEPANWFYYHLLDGDLASNHLSWQWVCGTFSSKKYYANQENISRYTSSNQLESFLDLDYESFINMQVPDILNQREEKLELKTKLPLSDNLKIDSSLPTFIYTYYNLDPNWHKDKLANRILLIEPSLFKKFPVSDNCIQFMIQLCKNISGIQIYVGEIGELKNQISSCPYYYKEHPLSILKESNEESRDWICEEVTGYYPSFFAYWKQIYPYLLQKFNP